MLLLIKTEIKWVGMERNNSLIIDFLAAVLLLTIISLIFMIGDRVFFEGRLSGRYYHHSKIYKIRQKVQEEKLKNLQLHEEIKIMNQEIRDTRHQNQQLIDKMQELFSAPPIPNDLAQYLEKGGAQAFAFFKSIFPVSQDIGDIGQLKLVQGKFYVGAPILFTSGSSELSPNAKQALDQAATTLKLIADRVPAESQWTVRTEGYTDNTAVRSKHHFKNNWGLSAARALSVVEYLTQKGIDGGKLVASGHGPYRSEQQSKLLELPHQRFVTLVLEAA